MIGRVQYIADLLVAQEGKCAICEKPILESGPRGSHVTLDHDHDTEQWRGLLCLACNVMVGWVERYLKVKDEVDTYLAFWKANGVFPSGKGSEEWRRRQSEAHKSEHCLRIAEINRLKAVQHNIGQKRPEHAAKMKQLFAEGKCDAFIAKRHAPFTKENQPHKGA